MIIGVNLNHDYAYCTIRDQDVTLIEVERESRIRHHYNDQSYSLTCLDDFSDLELKKIEAIYLNSPKMREIIKKDGDMSSEYRNYRYAGEYIAKDNIKGIAYGKIDAGGIMIPAAWVSHYHAHAASTFWSSPYKKADIICIDGGGDYGEGAAFQGDHFEIKLTKRFENAQLGSSYHHFSRRVYDGKPGFYESKVMAMASFGKKELSYNSYMNRNGGLNQMDKNANISIHDIAEFQDQFVKGVLKLIEKNRSCNSELCCAGGCFLNVNLNTVIANSNYYKSVYIPPYVGDMGTAIGCALYAHYDLRGNLPEKEKLDTAFLGKDMVVEIESLKDIITSFGDFPIDRELYT